jgi:2-phosphosulfolactate phosphatase
METPSFEIDVCLSPALYPIHAKPENVVVIIDVIRASATICTAFEYGVTEIVPLTDTTETLKYKDKGYLTAGERDSYKIDGFDFGNSPYQYMTDSLKGKKLAFTTTNGTKAIKTAASARKLLIGSFLNFDSLCKQLLLENSPVLLLCSGWKNAVSTEDVLLAGKIAKQLLETGKFHIQKDSVNIAIHLYEHAKDHLFEFIMKFSPRLESKRSWLEEDAKYCLSLNKTDKVPEMSGDRLVLKGI